MKRYEKMSKEEIMDLFVSIRKNKFNKLCEDCPFYSECDSDLTNLFTGSSKGWAGSYTCVERTKAWLEKEVNQVRRVSTLKTAEDVKRARKEHTVLCDERHANKNGCDGCKYNVAKEDGFMTCYDYFLAEPVEVEV